MLQGFWTEHCWCSNPVVWVAGLCSVVRGCLGFEPLAFCASAGLSNPGTTKLPAVNPVVAKANATIRFTNERIVSSLAGYSVPQPHRNGLIEWRNSARRSLLSEGVFGPNRQPHLVVARGAFVDTNMGIAAL